VVEAAEEPGRSFAALRRRETPPAVVTGGDGFFRIADLRTGENLRVTVRRAGYSIKSVAGVQVPLEEPLRIALEPSATVEGRTLDPDGKPVAGAQLLLLSRGFKKAVSGDDGAFRMEDVSPGSFELQAMAAGWQAASLNLELRPGQDLQGLEVILQPGALIEGRVLAPGGRPLAGAYIRSVDRTARMIRETEAAMSDGDGYYRMHSVAPGIRTFAAEHSEYRKATRELEVKPGRSSLDFVLEGGVDVSGRVVDDAGLPVSGVQVVLREGWRSWGRAASGPDGSFTLQGVAEGAYRIVVEKQGYARDEEGQELTVGGGPVSGVEMRLSRGGSIVGQISGLDFPQLSRVQVRVDGSDNFARVSPDGSYRIDHVMPGELRVVATLGSRQTEGKVELEPGAAEARLDLSFAEGLVLSGTVVRNGEPLQNRFVALNAPGVASRSSSTDHEGRFRFEGLEEGKYDLEVGWRGPGQHKETVELSRDTEVRIDLVTVTLTGRVVDSADRSPLPGAEVLVEPEGEGQGFRVGTTDSKGEFLLSDVPEGSWQVRSLLAGYAPGEVRVEVDAGAPQDALEIPLQATEGVTLEVFLPSGRPPDDVRAAVLDPSGRVVASATYPVSNEGRLRIASVAPGSWELLLDVDGAAPVSVSVRAPGHAGRVVLPSAGGLSLTVPALRAARIGAKVSLTDAAGKPYRFVWGKVLSVLDLDDGSVKIDRLAAGTWKLAVTADDGRTWTGTAVIIPGSKTEVALK
jgi:large repetitive protein